jgi:hypothetical protein
MENEMNKPIELIADELLTKNHAQHAEIVQLRQQVRDLEAALTECQHDQPSDYSDDFQNDCEAGKLAGLMGA